MWSGLTSCRTRFVSIPTHLSRQNNITGGAFGVYAATLTAPRVQQFSLRYSFLIEVELIFCKRSGTHNRNLHTRLGLFRNDSLRGVLWA
jgi:hypothetical protein